MKATRLILIAFCFSLLPSCALITSILKIPGSILKTAGRTVGIGLTDTAPEPIKDSEEELKETPEPAGDSE